MSEIQTNSYENSSPSTNPNFDPYRIEDLDFYLRNHCDTCAAGGSCDRTIEGHRNNFENGLTENGPTKPDTDPLSPLPENKNNENENFEEIISGAEADTDLDFDLQVIGKLSLREDGRLDVQHNYNGQLLFLGDASESKAEQEEFSALMSELQTRGSVISEPVSGHIFTYSINAEGEVMISYKNESEPEPQNEDFGDQDEKQVEVKIKPTNPEAKTEDLPKEIVKDKAQTVETITNKAAAPVKIEGRLSEPSSLQVLNKDSAQNTGISLDLKPNSIYIKMLELFNEKTDEKTDDPKAEVSAKIENSPPIPDVQTRGSAPKIQKLSDSYDTIFFSSAPLDNPTKQEKDADVVQIANGEPKVTPEVSLQEISTPIPSEIHHIEQQETYDSGFESSDLHSNDSRFEEDIKQAPKTPKTENQPDVFQAQATTDRLESIDDDTYIEELAEIQEEMTAEIQEEITEEEVLAEAKILETLTEQVKTIQTEVIKEARQVLETHNQTPTKVIVPTKVPITRTETVNQQETLERNQQALEVVQTETKAVFDRINSIDLTTLAETTPAHLKKIQIEIEQTQRILEILKLIRPTANETGPKITRTIPGRPTGMTAAQDPAETPQEIEAQLLKLAA